MDLRALHLFAGAGGGVLGGLLVGHVPVCAVEIDPYCQRVLIARQRDGLLPPFPLWDDARTFEGHPWRGRVDIIHAGFPCQPWSTAGPRRGEQDDRNLWPETCRIIGEVRPRYVFLENVPALVVQPYFGTILGELSALGYDAVWTTLGADDVGANHRRKRLWLLATDAQRGAVWEQSGGQPGAGGAGAPLAGDDGAAGPVADAPGDAGEYQQGQRTGIRDELAEHGAAWPVADVPDAPRQQVGATRQPWQHGDVGHANGQRCREQQQSVATASPWRGAQCAGWWQSEPGLDRVVARMDSRVDRLRAIGNGQVPLCAAVAWRLLLRASQHA